MGDPADTVVKDVVTVLPVVKTKQKPTEAVLWAVFGVTALLLIFFWLPSVNTKLAKCNDHSYALTFHNAALGCEIDVRVIGPNVGKHLTCNEIARVMTCMMTRLDITAHEIDRWAKLAVAAEPEWFAGCAMRSFQPWSRS